MLILLFIAVETTYIFICFYASILYTVQTQYSAEVQYNMLGELEETRLVAVFKVPTVVTVWHRNSPNAAPVLQM